MPRTAGVSVSNRLWQREIRSSPASSTERFPLYFGDAPIYHFDLDGRWQRAFLDGTHYLKGLDADVHAIARVREGPNLVLKRRTLAEAEADELDERVRSTALELIAGLDSGSLGRVEAGVVQSDTACKPRSCAIFWSVSARGTPPRGVRIENGTRPNWVPTLSCRLNARTPSSCKRLTVTRPRKASRQAIALGCGRDMGASAAAKPRHLPGGKRRVSSTQKRGRDLPERDRPDISDRAQEPRRHKEEAEGSEKPRFDGVHAFLDEFALARPDGDGWRQLAERGLVRISLGVVSGDVDVRRWYQKRWADEDLRAAVREIKAAGLGVSVLTLVGAGGIERAEPHVERTVRLIESLALGAGDFVFLLDEKELGVPNSVAREYNCARRPDMVEPAGKTQRGPRALQKEGRQGPSLYFGEAMDMNAPDWRQTELLIDENLMKGW